MEILLGLLSWLLPIGTGVAGGILVKSMELGFKQMFIYGLIFSIVTTIIEFIIIKIKDGEDFEDTLDSVSSHMFIYFLANIITFFVEGYLAKNSIFEAIVITISGGSLFNILPLIINIGLDKGVATPISNSNSYRRKNDVKSGDIYDKLGNKIGHSTTYNDSLTGVKKTYVKDNLGNNVAESTSIGNHTNTKINTTGRY